MSDESLFVLRPDGFLLKDIILPEIDFKLNLIYQREFYFNDDLTKAFYCNDIGKPHFEALLEYLKEGPSLVGIVKCEDVVEKLFELSGENTLPFSCSPNSLRYRYSVGETYTKTGKKVIKNLIHRSKTNSQYLREKEVFRNFFGGNL